MFYTVPEVSEVRVSMENGVETNIEVPHSPLLVW